jgi:hypothetical protein
MGQVFELDGRVAAVPRIHPWGWWHQELWLTGFGQTGG